MIFGIGTDISQVSRFKKWVRSDNMISRFFNENEIKSFKSEQVACEYYASRFAAKEAFGKALGTGIFDFELKDVFVTKDELGKPELNVTGKASELLKKRCGNCRIHISLSHEKEYAVAYVVIEKD